MYCKFCRVLCHLKTTMTNIYLSKEIAKYMQTIYLFKTWPYLFVLLEPLLECLFTYPWFFKKLICCGDLIIIKNIHFFIFSWLVELLPAVTEILLIPRTAASLEMADYKPARIHYHPTQFTSSHSRARQIIFKKWMRHQTYY